jgi:hypothetical protein
MGKNTIKTVVAGTMLSLLGGVTYAQNGLECMVVEKYYVSNADDAAGSEGVLPVGSVTYRIYADMLPGYKFQALYGIPGHALTLQTTTLFFNNEDRGATTPSYTKAQAAGNTIMLDSWFSVGGACSNQLGIMKSEDDGIGTVTNGDGILQNSDASAGIPLTTQDGFIAGTPAAVTFVGLSTAELEVFDATSNAGNSFTTSNASVACLGGSMGPVPATNKVLVGQFTTDGDFSFRLNVQIGTPTGGVENYVAQNPTGAEIMLPCLTFDSSLGTDVHDDPIAAASTINVYPNPATDVLRIDIKSTSKTTTNSYRIVNVLGTLVTEKNIGELGGTYSETIDMSGLSAGMYFVQFNLDNVKSTKKIIKK